MKRGIAILALLFLTSCTSLRLARLDPLPAGETFAGPEGSYQLVPPSDRWVRLTDNEGDANIDLSLARNSNDAWLNVSVLPGRFATADLALAYARGQADALMATFFRDERDVGVPAPEGDVAGRMGVYCGTFDGELRSRESCFVMLATVWKETSYLLVGQVRESESESGRRGELEGLMLSLRLVAPRTDEQAGR